MKTIKADNALLYGLSLICTVYPKRLGRTDREDERHVFSFFICLVTLFLFQIVSLSNTTQNVDFIPGLLLHPIQSKIVGINYHLSKPGKKGITSSCKLGPIERPLNIASKQNF